MESLDPGVIAAVVASLGIGGALAAVVNGLMQRRKIGADATVVVIAAARELVDPLRKELQTERTERAVEERLYLDRIAVVKGELEQCSREARQVHDELRLVRRQLADLHRDIERGRAGR